MKTKFFSVIVFMVLTISDYNLFAQHKKLTVTLKAGSTSASFPFIQKQISASDFNHYLISTHKSHSTKYSHDSTYHWKWDDTGDCKLKTKTIQFFYDPVKNQSGNIEQSWTGVNWINSIKNTYTFNSDDNLLSELNEKWNGFAWINANKITYTYAGANYSSITYQVWDGANWANDYRYMYTSDANNNETGSLYQKGNGTAWINLTQDIFTFDSNNNRTGYLTQQWDNNNSVWVNIYKYTYAYDANNNLTSYLVLKGNGTGWENFTSYTATYDLNNNETSFTFQNWDGTAWINQSRFLSTWNTNYNKLSIVHTWDGNAWTVVGKINYTYDLKHNVISTLNQKWDGTDWINIFRDTSTYNSTGFRIKQLAQLWDGTNWINSNQENHMFDAENGKTIICVKAWNSTGTKVILGDSIYFYYSPINAGINKHHTNNEKNIIIFPNPSNGQFRVEFKNTKQVSCIEVFNLEGEKILQQSSSEVTMINAARGFYLVKITDGAAIYSKKIFIR